MAIGAIVPERVVRGLVMRLRVEDIAQPLVVPIAEREGDVAQYHRAVGADPQQFARVARNAHVLLLQHPIGEGGDRGGAFGEQLGAGHLELEQMVDDQIDRRSILLAELQLAIFALVEIGQGVMHDVDTPGMKSRPYLQPLQRRLQCAVMAMVIFSVRARISEGQLPVTVLIIRSLAR